MSAQNIMSPTYACGAFVDWCSLEAVEEMIMDPMGAAKMGGRTLTRKPMDTAPLSLGRPTILAAVGTERAQYTRRVQVTRSASGGNIE